MVRVTGLEPVRRETHAPQTCLSASSSTLACVGQRIILYPAFPDLSSIFLYFIIIFFRKSVNEMKRGVQ